MTAELRAIAPDEATRIEILDPDLQPVPVDHNIGEVHCRVEPGVYAVDFRSGLRRTRRVVMVGPEDTSIRVELPEESSAAFATAAPLTRSTSTYPAQRREAERLSLTNPVRLGGDAAQRGCLFLFVRADADAPQGTAERLAHGLTLHELNGNPLAALTQYGETSDEARSTGVHLDLPVGTYRLRRHVGDGTLIEQALHVRHEWQTQFFALASPVETPTSGAVEFARVAVMMSPAGHGFDSAFPPNRHAEAALRALRERSSVPGSMSEQLLGAKFDNPLLGVLAVLLQLRRKTLSDDDIAALKSVVEKMLVWGGPIPDTLAVGLALLTRHPRLREDKTFLESLTDPAVGLPPNLNESWLHVIEASEWSTGLVPTDSLASRVSAQTNRLTPWFQWNLEADAPLAQVDEPRIIEFAGQSLWARGANYVMQALGVKRGVVDRLTLSALNGGLPAVQEQLAALAEPAAELEHPAYTVIERRIALYVYPLADPGLSALVAARLATAKKIEAGILSRGRDARELTRAMRMPAGTAILNVISLVDKLSRSVWAEPEDAAISRFVLAESVEGPAIAKALNELRKQKTELRHSKGSHELTRLSYLIMRYRATLWPVPDGPRPDDQFVDVRTNERATEETREQVLRDAVEALKAAVVADAKVPASEVDVAPTGTYAPGGLVRIRQQVLVPSP